MYTFVPGMGLGGGGLYSPYGFRYWSPFDVYMAYMPGYYYSPYGYGYPGYGYGSGYAGGRGVTRGSTSAGAYNSVNYKSVPTPSHSGGVLRGSGSAGSVASSTAPSSSAGSGRSSSMGSISSGGGAAISAPISHGGGGNTSHR